MVQFLIGLSSLHFACLIVQRIIAKLGLFCGWERGDGLWSDFLIQGSYPLRPFLAGPLAILPNVNDAKITSARPHPITVSCKNACLDQPASSLLLLH
jgi:hypothetical protein